MVIGAQPGKVVSAPNIRQDSAIQGLECMAEFLYIEGVFISKGDESLVMRMVQEMETGIADAPLVQSDDAW